MKDIFSEHGLCISALEHNVKFITSNLLLHVSLNINLQIFLNELF